MHALAKQCIDRSIREQVEKMEKQWADRAFAKELRISPLVSF